MCLGLVEVAMTIFTCYHGLLTASEALGLRWTHIVVTGQTVVLLLAVTKQGVEQKVVRTRTAGVSWVANFVKTYGKGKTQPPRCITG